MKQNHRNIAIVSGKGGSGKTLITTTLALGLARAGRKTLLVDADMGTGGLTYYLGFTAFDRTSGGVSEYIKTGELPRPAEPRKSHPLSKELSDNMKFIPAGGYRNIPNIDITEDSINGIIDAFDKLFDFIIFDCRGGIDDESISVCKSVDDIVIVAETDASSIQASAYLVESLKI